MKILLIGPYPPPHGGISVHVAGIHRQLRARGVACDVLDTGQGGLGLRFGMRVLRYAVEGWTLHLHTNGHNVKSWLLALGCGLARFGGGSILTLHSGMAPAYIESTAGRRSLAALVCSLYTRIICVNPEIRGVLISLGQDSERMEVLPAFLNVETPSVRLEAGLLAWIETHRPLFSTVLFFRPEYGFDLLIDCLARLKALHPSFGCIVMGSGDRRTEAEKRVRDSGLAENILLLGDVDHDTCLALMSRCDVFLRPTLEDGDSISVREALSMGVPVVASRVGMRPSGAILFAAGDVEEMVAKVSEAVSASATGQAEIACPTNFWGRLMDIYGQVDGSKGALCLN